MNNTPDENYLKKAKNILEDARNKITQSINHAMVLAYYEIGKLIIEQQEGNKRANYSEKTLSSLSDLLTIEFGRGFSVRNLEQMRKFYLVYSKTQTVSSNFKIPNFELSWSHYLMLMRIKKEEERKFYELESRTNNL